MPDDLTIKPESEFTPANAEPDHEADRLIRAMFVNLCALGLGVSFFLPWVHFLLGAPSGFDLQKLGHEQRLLWLIPVLCIITIVAGVTRMSQNVVGRLTGILPFIVGIYWYNKIGSDLLHILTYGAFLSLAFGLALIVLPGRSK